MNWRGIPSVEEIHDEENHKLKDFCEEHFGKDCCVDCHSVTASGWCKYHPAYKKPGPPERVVH